MTANIVNTTNIINTVNAANTDDFSKYPRLERSVPFMAGSGFAEIDPAGNIVESVNYISVSTALLSKRVRVRSYNHRYPEILPDGIVDVADGHYGNVYDHGGTPKNSHEAKHRANLYAKRLWVESHRAEGKGNSPWFHAGLRVQITHGGNQSLSGNYLLVSVKHEGGWIDGANTYRNEFTCVRAEREIYAPPLRTPVPRIDGITTAFVGAAGDIHPTLNEYGNYNVNMPYMIDTRRDLSGTNECDYGGSKQIRLAQPSTGISNGKLYGQHFPAKRGAEMVLAHIDGDPDRPVGIGFVPNAASPSVVRDGNHYENVLRTWGGSELVMDDTPGGNENLRLATPEKRILEMHDGEEYVKLKSADSELEFNDKGKYAKLDVSGHVIGIIYKDCKGQLTIRTADGNVIRMDDPDDVITIQNINDDNKVVLNGKDKSITLDSSDNTVVVNGKDNRITVESAKSKGVFDGNGEKIMFENKDNKIILDGGSNSITLSAEKSVIIKAGDQLVVDAKNGINNLGKMYDVN